jgi:hypothetical protein
MRLPSPAIRNAISRQIAGGHASTAIRNTSENLFRKQGLAPAFVPVRSKKVPRPAGAGSVLQTRKGSSIQRRKVIAHAANKEDVYKALLNTRGKNVAIEHCGNMPEDLVVMFCLEATR